MLSRNEVQRILIKLFNFYRSWHWVQVLKGKSRHWRYAPQHLALLTTRILQLDTQMDLLSYLISGLEHHSSLLVICLRVFFYCYVTATYIQLIESDKYWLCCELIEFLQHNNVFRSQRSSYNTCLGWSRHASCIWKPRWRDCCLGCCEYQWIVGLY